MSWERWTLIGQASVLFTFPLDPWSHESSMRCAKKLIFFGILSGKQTKMGHFKETGGAIETLCLILNKRYKNGGLIINKRCCFFHKAFGDCHIIYRHLNTIPLLPSIGPLVFNSYIIHTVWLMEVTKERKVLAIARWSNTKISFRLTNAWKSLETSKTTEEVLVIRSS